MNNDHVLTTATVLGFHFTLKHECDTHFTNSNFLAACAFTSIVHSVSKLNSGDPLQNPPSRKRLLGLGEKLLRFFSTIKVLENFQLPKVGKNLFNFGDDRNVSFDETVIFHINIFPCHIAQNIIYSIQRRRRGRLGDIQFIITLQVSFNLK